MSTEKIKIHPFRRQGTQTMRSLFAVRSACVIALVLVGCAGAVRAQTDSDNAVSKTATPTESPSTDSKAKSSEMKVPGFMGIKWDDSQATARKIMAAKGFQIDEKHSGKWQLCFDGGKVAGEKPAFTLVRFSKEGFWEAMVLFSKLPENGSISFYDKMKDLISSKYQEPSSSYKKFKSPYYEGDGYEEQAIRVGKADFSAYWEFKDESTILALEITQDLDVKLVYEYSKREQEETDRVNAEKAKDL